MRRATGLARVGRFLFGLGLLVDAAQPLLTGLLDQPVPVDRIAAGALGASLADELVVAADHAAGPGRRAAADAGAADILHLQRPVGPALVDRIVGVRAQVLGNAETLAFILAH